MPRLALIALSLLACTTRNDAPYGLCASSAQCAEATPRCVTFRNRINGLDAHLCTSGCSSSADCPDNGVCVNTETPGLGGLCVKACLQDSDCGFTGGYCVEVPPNQHGCVP